MATKEEMEKVVYTTNLYLVSEAVKAGIKGFKHACIEEITHMKGKQPVNKWSNKPTGEHLVPTKKVIEILNNEYDKLTPK